MEPDQTYKRLRSTLVKKQKQRLLRQDVVAIGRITEVELVRQFWMEGVDILNADQTIVESLIGSEPGNIGPCAPKTGQCQEL